MYGLLPPISRNRKARTRNNIPRDRAKSGPTDDLLNYKI